MKAHLICGGFSSTILSQSIAVIRRGILFLLTLGFCLGVQATAFAGEISGFVLGEARLFPQEPLYAGQNDQSGSFAFQPEYYHEWEGGSSFTFVPFYRLDSADSERTHFDIREFTFLWLRDSFELRLGVGKVFWGTTEVLHLVDVINQTDLVENGDTEDKLGQPMVNLSLARDWGTVDLFLLPYFRERTFAGRDGRQRGAAVVDTDRTKFESGAKEWHTDWAVRYSHIFGDWDVGVSHFMGTGREPGLLDGTDASGTPIKIPLYEQINQTGLDVSYVYESWLWKLETIHRAGQGSDDFFALTGGFEYTFTGIFGSRMDLGVLSEWMYDDRGSDAKTAFENDVVAGLRLAANDAASSEIFFGWVQDVDTSARLLFIEASRRFGENWLMTLEVRSSFDQPDTDLFFEQRDDDVAQLELAYYF